MAAKKTPMRMCTGCREMHPRTELIRVVKTPEGEVKLDTGRLNGRGAYLCKRRECLEKAEKSNALSRAFEMNVGPDIYEKLRKEFENFEQ